MEKSILVDIQTSDPYKPYVHDIDENLHYYNTERDGLTLQEVKRRQENSEKNKLNEEEKESLIQKYLGQFTEPLILLLLVSAIVSVIVGQYDDAASIVLAVIIVSTVAFIQEYRSEKSLEALTQFVSHQCEVVREGRVTQIAAEDLVKGDVVLLSRGQRVPSDVRLIEAVELRIDESILTGEANPTKKSTAPLEDVDTGLADRRNMAFMGTMIIQGKGRGVVTHTGPDTELGKISQMMQSVESSKTPLQIKMDQLGKHLSVMSFVIIGLIFLIGTLQGKSLLKMFNVGVSLAVAAIPEGLPIVVTVTLALGVSRMAKRNAIVRRLPAVEALGGISLSAVIRQEPSLVIR